MTAVAEGCGLGLAAAAEPCLGHALHDAAGAGAYFQVAFDFEGAVALRLNSERAIACGERIEADGLRLAAGAKGDIVMRAIAKGFVF